MSTSFERGRSFELKVQRITHRLLGLDVKRDRQSGAGVHKQDIRDRYNELPIFIECKDQQTLKPKEWWRIADGKSSVGQAPIVVFPDDEEVLCVMRYSDLLQFIKEASDWRTTADGMRVGYDPGAPEGDRSVITEFADPHNTGVVDLVNRKLKEAGTSTCRNGHLAIDGYGYCISKGCPYSRGYKKPKVKK